MTLSKLFRVFAAILTFTFSSIIVGNALPSLAQSSDALHLTRTWTSQSGKQVEARFLRLDNGWVFLQIPPNKEISIKLTNLSEEDQKLVGSYWITNGFSFEALEENLRSSLPVKPIRDPQGNLVIAHEGIYSGWLYATVTNTTFNSGDVKTDMALLLSKNAVPFMKKKEEECTFLILCLGYKPHVGNIVLLVFSNDRAPRSDNRVLISFDEKPPIWVEYKPIPKSEVFFLNNSKKIVSELKKSKSFSITVKVPSDANTPHSFSFNTFDLHWKH